MRKETENWLSASEYDINTAEHLLKSGRYLYVVFMCHLAIEKTMKAIITEDTKKLPPKTHDLIYLADLTSIRFPANLLDFIGKINSASIVTRYPEDIKKAVAAYSETVASDYLDKTKEAVNWLRLQRKVTE